MSLLKANGDEASSKEEKLSVLQQVHSSKSAQQISLVRSLTSQVDQGR